MVINMDETQLRTIEQIEQFLAASAEVAFTVHGNDVERYAHISRVLKRFDYPRCNKHERGVLLRYLQHTSGYSRAQVTRLVRQWHTNRLSNIPLIKRYNHWLNLHRPCMFATTLVNAKGKVVKVYKHEDAKTPLQRRKCSKPSGNCLSALQNKNDGLDTRRLTRHLQKNWRPGGGSGGLAGA